MRGIRIQFADLLKLSPDKTPSSSFELDSRYLLFTSSQKLISNNNNNDNNNNTILVKTMTFMSVIKVKYLFTLTTGVSMSHLCVIK